MIYLTLNIISSSNKYLLSAYCVPNSVTGDSDSTEPKTDKFCLQGIYTPLASPFVI